ncbi:MAG: glycosyltransferase family 4 protein [Verrucomicrobiae bacterium]|nr:glycosyltransferase family 4 protein [Verrucomicrobiae bacterium]
MKPLRVIYICTTFPKLSEQFIQREVDGLRGLALNLEIISLWGGDRLYKGIPIRTFPKIQLLHLIWTLPWAIIRQPASLLNTLGKFFSGKPPSALNFFETLLGYGYALVSWVSIKKDPPDLVHGIWATSPVSAAYFLNSLTGVPYSMGAHAFDVFEDGGDWHLKEKLDRARMVHSSSQNTAQQLIRWGADPEKVKVIRRGLTEFPKFKPLRKNRRPIRIVSVGRLVEKKGFFYQLDIYKALKQNGVPYLARLVGSGDLDVPLRDYRDKSGLHNDVEFWGQLTFDAVQKQLFWADLFLFTGRISSKGDRDGLPNVIGESMAHGVVVLTTEVGATTEAVRDQETGLVLPADDVEAWVAVVDLLMRDDQRMEYLRTNGREWVEENFDAHKNSKQLLNAFHFAVGGGDEPPSA